MGPPVGLWARGPVGRAPPMGLWARGPPPWACGPVGLWAGPPPWAPGPPLRTPRTKNSAFLIFRIFRSFQITFWHAETIDLVESFRNHQSDLKKVHWVSSYGQNTPKIETWSQCCILIFCDLHPRWPGSQLRPWFVPTTESLKSLDNINIAATGRNWDPGATVTVLGVWRHRFKSAVWFYCNKTILCAKPSKMGPKSIQNP